MSDIEEKRSRVQDICDSIDYCSDCPCSGQDCCHVIGTATEAQLDAMLKAFEQDPVSVQPKEAEAPKILDSGERTQYSTGAVRDCKEGKGRCDLMPLDVVAGIIGPGYGEVWCIEKFQSSGNCEFLYSAIKKFCSEKEAGKTPDVRLCSAMLKVAKHFEEGAKKYGENNWQKGIPVHSYIDSAIRHYLKFRAGWTDEPHDRAFVWNLMCCIWTMEHHPELDDFTDKRVEK